MKSVDPQKQSKAHSDVGVAPNTFSTTDKKKMSFQDQLHHLYCVCLRFVCL